MKELVFQGNSGCSIECIERQGVVLVRKSSKSHKYGQRLKAQMKKQIWFGQNKASFLASIPEVVRSEKDGSGFCFEMEYATGIDSLSFLQTASRCDIDRFAVNLLAFIDSLVNRSEKTPWPENEIEVKLEKIALPLKKHPFYAALNMGVIYEEAKRFVNRGETEGYIPVGICHGDLTLSNILVTRDKGLCLVDFLDSFVETPLQDMVKLRQDSQFGWSLHLYNKQVDETRFHLSAQYLDELLQAGFNQYDFYRQYYARWQAINLLRILPYIRNQLMGKLVINSIRSIIAG